MAPVALAAEVVSVEVSPWRIFSATLAIFSEVTLVAALEVSAVEAAVVAGASIVVAT